MTSTNQSPMSLAYKSCLSCLGWPTLKVFLRQNFVRQLTKAVSNPVGKDKRVNSVLLERKQTTKALKELF